MDATPPRSFAHSSRYTHPPDHVEVKEEDSDSSISLRKRSRDVLDDSLDDCTWDLNDDGRPKTRRVNPQRLAIRLGPDLVAEMEALIVPGAKMPTFAVRKDFQERYNVDRRHIYDYFHSRGLRVAKEDKHTNLIRGRAMKAQALAQAQAEAAAKAASNGGTHTSPPTPQLTKPMTSESAKPVGRPPKRPKTLKKKRGAIGRPPNMPFLVAKSTGSETSQRETSTDRSPDPGEQRSPITSGTETDWETRCPQFTFSHEAPCASKANLSGFSDFLPPPSSSVMGYLEQPSDFGVLGMGHGITLDMRLDVLSSDAGLSLLSHVDCEDFYQLIDSSLPRLAGTEDSGVGGALSTAKGYQDATSGARTALSPKDGSFGTSGPHWGDEISLDCPDIGSWLVDDLDPCSPLINSSTDYPDKAVFDSVSGRAGDISDQSRVVDALICPTSTLNHEIAWLPMNSNGQTTGGSDKVGGTVKSAAKQGSENLPVAELKGKIASGRPRGRHSTRGV